MSDPTMISPNANSAGLRVEIRQSSIKQTSDSSQFGNMVGEGLSRALDVASPYVPGAAVVQAAIQGVKEFKPIVAGNGQTAVIARADTASNAGTFGGSGTVTGSGTGSTAGTTTSTSSDPIERAQQYAVQNQSVQLQYLELQQGLQAENQKITTISNCMKTKHDTAKNSISNIR